jgi:hypothetical protein
MVSGKRGGERLTSGSIAIQQIDVGVIDARTSAASRAGLISISPPNSSTVLPISSENWPPSLIRAS